MIRSLMLLMLATQALSAQEVDLYKEETVHLGNGLYSHGTFRARSIFVVTDDGVIATDPVNQTHAARMREAIAALTDQPVKYVVYSHQHWDHVAGGQIFKDEGATFVSHSACVPHFERHPNPDIVPPDVTFDGNGEVALGGKVLRLMYLGPNHGDCMFVMRLDGTDVLFVNDLVTPYSVGLGFMPDYDPVLWLRTLETLEADESWSRMVGGHGIPVAPREALTQRRRYLAALMDAVRSAIDEGRRFDQLYASIELPEEFRSMRGYDSQLERAAERIYHYYTMGW